MSCAPRFHRCRQNFGRLSPTCLLVFPGSFRRQTRKAGDVRCRFPRRHLSAVAKSTQVQDPHKEQEASTEPVFQTTGKRHSETL